MQCQHQHFDQLKRRGEYGEQNRCERKLRTEAGSAFSRRLRIVLNGAKL
jgi:hypothetical protein